MKRTIITLILSATVFLMTLVFTNAYVSQKSIYIAEKINEMALNNCALYISNAALCAEDYSVSSLSDDLGKNLPYGRENSAMFMADSTNTIIASSHEWIKESRERLKKNTDIFKPEKYVDGIYLPLKYEGKQYYVYKRPTIGDKCTIYTVCSEDSIYKGARHALLVVLLTSLVGMILMMICFAAILRQVRANLRTKAAVEEELKIAAKVQTSLLKPTSFTLNSPLSPLSSPLSSLSSPLSPLSSPLSSLSSPLSSLSSPLSPLSSKLSSISLNAFMQPAKEAGGDLYDYVEKDGKLIFCIGDVSGKGMPAALFMTQVVSLFRSVVRSTAEPSEIASGINNVLASNNPDMTFCTFFVGVLTGDTLTWCNAGHNPPVLLTQGSAPQFLKVRPNLALGLMEDFPYTSETMEFTEGKSLLLYTDGVTEAKNQKHNEFTAERLLESLSRTSADVINTVLDDVRSFVAGYEQSDDITLVHIS